ncbi:hypothetical protein ACWD01_29750 [Streptomyces sp. NPDC002835]|jgi:hypothetical protein
MASEIVTAQTAFDDEKRAKGLAREPSGSNWLRVPISTPRQRGLPLEGRYRNRSRVANLAQDSP